MFEAEPLNNRLGASGSPFGHSTVESAERKALWTLRVDAQADERCPAELLLPVLAVDRALYPDGAALQHRIHTTLGEHRHVSRREMRHHRDRILGIGGQLPISVPNLAP